MQNITLVRGRCSVCDGPIDKEWAGNNPSLGTTCRDHFSEGYQIFQLENVELKVDPRIVYNPLFGTYEYHFDFQGTKIMVNGQVGKIWLTYFGSSTVKFPGDDKWGTSIKNIDYHRLKDLYEQSGGQIAPPKLDMPNHKPIKAELLDTPLYSVTIEHQGSVVTGVEVGSWETGNPDFPMYQTLYDYCNIFVRWLFGLSTNLGSERHLVGADFEIRHNMMGSGLLVQRCSSPYDPARDVELNDMLYQQAQSRAKAMFKQADAASVIRVWAHIMETLLCYDWRSQPYETVEDIWRSYCSMQDVLMNIFNAETIAESLAYARSDEAQYIGFPY